MISMKRYDVKNKTLSNCSLALSLSFSHFLSLCTLWPAAGYKDTWTKENELIYGTNINYFHIAVTMRYEHPIFWLTMIEFCDFLLLFLSCSCSCSFRLSVIQFSQMISVNIVNSTNQSHLSILWMHRIIIIVKHAYNAWYWCHIIYYANIQRHIDICHDGMNGLCLPGIATI